MNDGDVAAIGDSNAGAKRPAEDAVIRYNNKFDFAGEVSRKLQRQKELRQREENSNHDEELIAVEGEDLIVMEDIPGGVELLKGLDKKLNDSTRKGNKKKRRKERKNADSSADGAQSGEGGELTWRDKVALVRWGCGKSMEQQFPRPVGQCGSIVPPKYLFARIENPLIKVHALKHWHTLTHKEQTLLKKAIE